MTTITKPGEVSTFEKNIFLDPSSSQVHAESSMQALLKYHTRQAQEQKHCRNVAEQANQYFASQTKKNAGKELWDCCGKQWRLASSAGEWTTTTSGITPRSRCARQR